jgi:hypothetical protein
MRDPPVVRRLLVFGQASEQLADPLVTSDRGVDAVDLAGFELERLVNTEPPSGPIFDPTPTNAPGEGVARDRKQPRRGRSAVGSVSRRRAERSGEYLGG